MDCCEGLEDGVDFVGDAVAFDAGRVAAGNVGGGECWAPFD